MMKLGFLLGANGKSLEAGKQEREWSQVCRSGSRGAIRGPGLSSLDHPHHL